MTDPKTISYQGEPGANSHIICAEAYPDWTALPCPTFEDAFALQSSDRWAPDQRTDQVRGRLDAVQVAARVAPLTRSIERMGKLVSMRLRDVLDSYAAAEIDRAARRSFSPGSLVSCALMSLLAWSRRWS